MPTKISKNNKPKDYTYSGNLKFASICSYQINSIQKQKLLKKLLPTKSITKAKLFLAASLQPEELPIILDAYFKAQKKITSLYLVLIHYTLHRKRLLLVLIPKQLFF